MTYRFAGVAIMCRVLLNSSTFEKICAASTRHYKYIREEKQLARMRYVGSKRPSGFEFKGDWAFCYWFTTKERPLDYIGQ